MNETPSYIAYVDLVGIGDASIDEGDEYYKHLQDFRLALCDAVDICLTDVSDQVFAFSDCAFASSQSLVRLGNYLLRLQRNLWMKNIYFKGAISRGEADHFYFTDLSGQSRELKAARKKKLHGYWFNSEFIQPALLEKNLKGIAIQVDKSFKDEAWIDKYKVDAAWLKKHTVYSCYFPTDVSKKPVVIMDMSVPKGNLPSLNYLLRTYMTISHSSKRLSRYYVPLIITWIKSFDYSTIKSNPKTGELSDLPLPMNQLILNPKIASEVLSLVGGNLIFYALLAKVSDECKVEVVKTRVLNFMARNKKLREAAELIPDEICPRETRLKVVNSRIKYLFDSVN